MPTKLLPDIRVLKDGELRLNTSAHHIYAQGIHAPFGQQVRLGELFFAAHILSIFRAHPNVLSFRLMFACTFEVDGTQNIPKVVGQAWPGRLRVQQNTDRWPTKSHGLLHPDDVQQIYQSIFGDGMYGHPNQWEADFSRESFTSILDKRIVNAAAAVDLVKALR